MSPLDLSKDPEFVTNEAPETTEESATLETSPDPSSNYNEEPTVSETPEIEVATTQAESSTTDYNSFSKVELVAALTELLHKDISHIKEEVEYIKQAFYKKVKTQAEDDKQSFIDNGGEELDFKSAKDETEDAFKELLNQYRTRKADLSAKIEKEKESNLVLKQQILEQMKQLVESNDDVSSHINDFRALQQKWKSIGQVPVTAINELLKQYNLYQESFWDLIKINNELREYDFKKNLEAKTSLCELAEKLANTEDIVSAFQHLQKLHEEWHDLGPVARELRDEIWNRFKEASTVINKKHQAHFEEIRKLEEKNFHLKTEICERIEAIDLTVLKTYKDWDDTTQQILTLQEEWRTIGFAPRKVNQKLFDRYRKACDNFFGAKGEFYKETKSTLNKNAEIKRALCEKAEALKDSQDWKESSDKLVQLQKEWKKTGPAGKKVSDELWKRFITACDYFFEQKNKSTENQRTAETENLSKKLSLIEQINTLEKSANSNDTLNKLRSLMAEWNNIGYVPFKDKDRIYKEYRKAVDKQFDELNIDSINRRMDNFRSNLKDMSTKGENKLYKERDKLVHAYEHLKAEIATYENNIGFFSSSSKKGGKLILEMERKIEALKEESNLIEQKINLIDENLD